MIRFMKALGGVLLASALVACGGGGGSSGTTSTGGGVTPTLPGATPPASIDVFTSTPELSSASSSSLTFTVVAKDANNQALPNQTVTFSATSGNLIGSVPAPSTGPAGEPITSVSLTPGSDRSNRTITVTVTAASVSKQIVIPVTGTTLTASGDSFVLVGGSTLFTVRGVDSSGSPIPNATLTVVSSLGNAVAPATLTTNTQGIATFTYTGTRSGSDTLTITGLGARATASVAVSADEFRFDAPASATNVPTSTAQAVSVRFLRNGAPVVGSTVTFSTTRGSITPSSAVTDANGVVSASVSSTSAGPATVLAQTGTSQVSLPLTFVATTPATLVLQANPGAVAPNTTGSTTNQSTLQATVRDPSGNPVAGKLVNFTAIVDGSSGSIAPGSSLTDASGTATTQFIPGSASTANNGVVVQATVQGTGVVGTAALTVNTQALFISIATGNTISNLNETTYQKEFAVYVTDANGTPAGNRIVNLSVLPTVYFKGTMTFLSDNGGWVRQATAACPNEDRDRDGILDAGEDTNNNGRLDPGLPVVVTPAAVTTDATGFATFRLQYGENFAPWLNVDITARATVGGTESVKSQFYAVVGLASDFTDATIPPAGVISPFGTSSSCSNPN